MSTVADVISDARVELNDANSSRWTDANLVTLIAKCVRRTNDLLIRYQMKFAESSDTFSTVVGTSAYSLPSDYDTPISLRRSEPVVSGPFDSDFLVHTSDEDWPLIYSCQETSRWRVSGAYLQIKDDPEAVWTMEFKYYPVIDTSSYATTTTMPWSGKVDDIISEYLIVRCGNIDEADVNFDKMLESEITRGRLKKYEALRPQGDCVKGFYA